MVNFHNICDYYYCDLRRYCGYDETLSRKQLLLLALRYLFYIPHYYLNLLVANG